VGIFSLKDGVMANYTKLKDGSWGIRVMGPIAAGQEVTVTKANGEQKVEEVKAVVWTDGQVSVCSICVRSAVPTSRRRSWRGPSARRCMWLDC
jgi:hypothetical protein